MLISKIQIKYKLVGKFGITKQSVIIVRYHIRGKLVILYFYHMFADK